MKENPRIRFLWLLLILSIFCFISVVSVSAYLVTIVYPVHSSNNYYSAEVTNNNYLIFRGGGQELWSQKINHQIGSIAISSDGEYLAVGCEGGIIYLYTTDWSPVLVWERTFGDALIKSISLPATSNFIEASNVLNQEFLISRAGNLISGPTTPVIAPIPSAKVSLQESLTQPDSLPIKIDAPIDFGDNIFFWILIAVIILVVFGAIISSHRKKGSTVTYRPQPQSGTIYADSTPLGANIYLDGSYAGVSPFTISNVLPGTHTMKAALNGYNLDTQRITINAGQTFIYSPTLRKSSLPKAKPQPKPPSRTIQPKISFQDLITNLGSKIQQDREEAQKQLIIQVNTEGRTTIQQIIKELEKQPSGVKREIVNLLYYLSKESHEGQKVTDELITALTYSSPEVKWLIIQTLGRLKDKRAIHALEAAVTDADFLVKYWAIISLKNLQES